MPTPRLIMEGPVLDLYASTSVQQHRSTMAFLSTALIDIRPIHLHPSQAVRTSLPQRSLSSPCKSSDPLGTLPLIGHLHHSIGRSRQSALNWMIAQCRTKDGATWKMGLDGGLVACFMSHPVYARPLSFIWATTYASGTAASSLFSQTELRNSEKVISLNSVL